MIPTSRLVRSAYVGLFVGVVLAAAPPLAAQPVSTPDSLDAVYARVKQAAIEILVEDHLNGSGVFVEASGLALTAAHTIDRPNSRVEVLTASAGRRKAEIVAVNLGADLVLLRVEPREGGYPALPLAAQSPPAGEEVFLLGTPIFRHAVMLRGMMGRDAATFEFLGDWYVEVLHIAATAPSGTSGGPWFNRRGELVGIQSAVMSSNGIPVGVAFASPLTAIRKLLESRRTASTPTLGAAFEETWQQAREVLSRFPPQTEGLVVRVLRDDGPAARAGLKQWDVITQADGQKVRLPDELLGLVLRKKPQDSLTLDVLGPDGTGSRQVTVTLGRLEVGWPDK
jgi:S1-C subfamily serine protease